MAINHPLEKTIATTDGLAVATGGAKEAAVSVQMAQEGNLEAKRLLKEQQAEAKRRANALPVWIAQSTVSGELTGAGMKQGSLPIASSGVSFLKPSVPEPVDDMSVGDGDLDAYFTKLQRQSGSLLSSASSHDAKLSPSHSASTLNSPSQSCGSVNGNNPKRPRADHDLIDEGYGSIKGSPYDHADLHRGPKKAKVQLPTVHLVQTANVDSYAGDEEVKTMMLGGKLIDINSVTEEMEHNMVSWSFSLSRADIASRNAHCPPSDARRVPHLWKPHHGQLKPRPLGSFNHLRSLSRHLYTFLLSSPPLYL